MIRHVDGDRYGVQHTKYKDNLPPLMDYILFLYFDRFSCSCLSPLLPLKPYFFKPLVASAINFYNNCLKVLIVNAGYIANI